MGRQHRNSSLTAQQFTTTPKNARRIGHIISDIIYKQLTSFDGYFDTRIVFVSEEGPKDKRVKRLAIMDQDGFNVRALTDGTDLVLTPRFSPSTNEITYMSFGNDTPRVYLMNIDTKQREIVGEFPNMSFSPRFSPDGQRVIMSLQDGGNANIFELDLRSRALRQITNVAAINTAPSYSPDGGADRLRIGSRRHTTDLCDGVGWLAARTASASAMAAIRRRCGRRTASISPSPSRAAASSPSA